MPITEERIGKLTDFGFSETAARVYLALLDLGIAEARDISTLSRVPTSKIYHTLDKLHERGLVTIHPEFPKRYAPVPFERFLNDLKRQHEVVARNISEQMDDLARTFSIHGDAEVSGEEGDFVVIRGRRNVMQQVEDMYKEATGDVLVLGTTGTILRAEALRDGLPEPAKGVRFRALIPVTPELVSHLDAFTDVAEIRERTNAPHGLGRNVSILIQDDDAALIAHFNPDDGHIYQGRDVAIRTDHEPMVRALRTLAEGQWNTAPDYGARREEILSGRPREFLQLHRDTASLAGAIRQAASRGVRDVQGAGVLPDCEPQGAWDAAYAAIADRTDLRFRFVTDNPSEERARAAVKRLAVFGRVEVRHTPETPRARGVLVDGREAFQSLGNAVEAGPSAPVRPLVIHTSSRDVVAALGAEFERAWAAGRTLAEGAPEVVSTPERRPSHQG